jgi:hypothetical protein
MRQPMKLVADEKGRKRYVCASCGDSLQDPAASKWAESPLRPAAK